MPLSSLLLFASFAVFHACAEQKCYHDADRISGPGYVPCSRAIGIQTCCMLGDVCLTNSACWAPFTNLTYIAGCTDPTYQSPECGAKQCDRSGEYVLLLYCDDMSWKCCQGAAGAKAASDVACDCSTADIAFTAASSLSALASLPAISGEPTLVYSSSAAWKMSTETRQLFVSKSIQAWPTPPPSPASPQPTKPGTLLLQQRAPQPQTSSSPTLTLAYTADNTTAANAYASGVSRLTVDLAVGLSVGIAAVIAIVVAVLWWRRRHGHTISSSPGYMAKPSWQDTVSTSVGSGKGKEARRRVDSSPSRRGQVTELAEWTG